LFTAQWSAIYLHVAVFHGVVKENQTGYVFFGLMIVSYFSKLHALLLGDLRMRKLIFIVICAYSLPLTFAQDEKVVRFERAAKRIVKAINEGNYADVGRDFDRDMEDFFPLDKRKPFFENLSAQYGKINSLDKPRLTGKDQALFISHCDRGKLDITIWLSDQDRVTGLLFLPHKEELPVPQRNRTKLSLPFAGKWLVTWGGDTKELNQHHDARNQRFAFDFLGVGADGKTRKGNKRENEDYYAFDREILAPADGLVTDVITGVRDNVPGSMNPYSGLGNAVFIQHSQYEISVLAHLKRGSVEVQVGDRVKRGQLIGRCGNSGNSSEPHLHYHLQNTPIIQDGTGIKCYYQKMIVLENGQKKLKADYSPIKGEILVAE
jgi:hypothetical protein